jgi:hypothetical protein
MTISRARSRSLARARALSLSRLNARSLSLTHTHSLPLSPSAPPRPQHTHFLSLSLPPFLLPSLPRALCHTPAEASMRARQRHLEHLRSSSDPSILCCVCIFCKSNLKEQSHIGSSGGAADLGSLSLNLSPFSLSPSPPPPLPGRPLLTVVCGSSMGSIAGRTGYRPHGLG